MPQGTVVWAAGLMLLLGLSTAAAAHRYQSSVERGTEEAPVAGQNRIVFKNACAKGDRISIVGVGDLLFHRELEQEALTPTGNYRQFWGPVADVLAKADLTYGNLEGTVADGVNVDGEVVKDPGKAWNNRVYEAGPLVLSYNYHPSLVGDLMASGFSVVSTANTHSLDRGTIGIDRTVDNLEKGPLAFTGTRKHDASSRPFSVVTKTHGLNIAWLACTYATNGNRDKFGQVLYCFEQRDQVLAEIKRLSEDASIDAVIFTPHWGTEGSPTPEKRQRDLARDAVEAGATAVIGTHVHVLAPWEKIVTSDGREGLVVYSTGNFISNQRRPEQRMGEIAAFELLKEPGAAKMRVSAASYIVTWVDITSVHRVVEAPKSLVARALPAGNRIAIADLPKFTRDCASGETAETSWGNKDAVVEQRIVPIQSASGLAKAPAVQEGRR